MEIMKELDQTECDELKEKHKRHQLFETHILSVVDGEFDNAKHNPWHCYQVEIFPEDCDEILILSGLKPHHTLSEAVRDIQTAPEFLATPPSQAVLNGSRVKYYLDKLAQCQIALPEFFPYLHDEGYSCFMLDRNGHEITDGMHRLVAYGLATRLAPMHFPISIYFGTDKTLPVISSEDK